MGFVKRNAAALSFSLLALAGSYGLYLNAEQSTNQLEKSVRAACKTANVLRVESNSRVRSHMVLKEAAEDALKSTATARRAAYKKTGQEADRVAAERATELLHKIERDVRYNETPLRECPVPSEAKD